MQPLQAAQIAARLADEHERPIRPPAGRLSEQLAIDVVADQPEVAQHGPRKVLDVVGDGVGRQVGRRGEVLVIDPV